MGIRSPRRNALLGIGASVLALAGTSMLAIVAVGSSPPERSNGPSALAGPTDRSAPSPVRTTAAPPSPTHPTAEPDPSLALADGAYPACIRGVDVDGDLRIHLLGECESQPDRHAALTELARAATPFTETYYYSVTVADGVIHDVSQHLAIPAC